MDVNGLRASGSVASAQAAGARASADSRQQDGSASLGVSSDSPLYFSPVTTVDSTTGSAILEYRDTKTGKELYQIPAHAALLYRQAQQLAARQREIGGAVSVAG